MLLPCRIRSASERRAPSRAGLSRGRLSAAALVLAVLGMGGCAQSPQQLGATQHPKEYFPASIYGPASRRVIADGQPIPPGGGQYLVGKPYTVAGQTYYPSERKITQVGLASWYGDAFHGRLTANGEIYDRDGFSAAHPTMPLPSYARVTNLRNNHSMIVRVNDRGPYHANRIMDVSKRVADALDFQRGGTSKVKVEYVGRASLAGSDNARLYATLRTDGPARAQGLEGTTAVAEVTATAPTHVASLAPDAPLPTERRRPAFEGARPNELERYRVPRALASRVEHSAEASRPHLAAEASAHRFPVSNRHENAAEMAEAAFRPVDRRAGTGSHPHDAVDPRKGGSRDIAALIRSDRVPAAEVKGGQLRGPAHVAGRDAHDALRPPTRPVRFAAAMVPPTAHHHDPAGLRVTR